MSLIGEKLDLKNSSHMQSRLQHIPVQVASKEFVEMVEQAYLLKKGKDQPFSSHHICMFRC